MVVEKWKEQDGMRKQELVARIYFMVCGFLTGLALGYWLWG